MNALETLRNAIPDAAKDLRLNLGIGARPAADAAGLGSSL